jgi:DNA-binding HxlR family transcriptional regulator
MGPDHVYRHFCMTARALEAIGERWTLLIVRDLLVGPRRFSDLERGLSDITPTRLTDRLKLLESAGIVARDSSLGGREV